MISESIFKWHKFKLLEVALKGNNSNFTAFNNINEAFYTGNTKRWMFEIIWFLKQAMVNKFLSKIFVRNETDTGCLERFRQTSFVTWHEKKGYFIKGGCIPVLPPFSNIGGSTRFTQL